MNFRNNIKNEFIRFRNEVNNNEIYIEGDIGASLFTDGYDFNRFKDDLSSVEGEVVINIKSYGGDLFEALAIYDMIKGISNHVTTNIVGATASAGTVIAYAGDTRRITKNSRYLIHKPMVGAMGNSDDIRKVLATLESLDRQLVNLYAENAKLDKEGILSLMIREEFITAEKALEYGFVDEIIPEKSLNKVTNQKTEEMEKVLKALNVDSEDKALNAIDEFKNKIKVLNEEKEEKEEEMAKAEEEKEEKEKEIEDLKAEIAKLKEKLKAQEEDEEKEEAENIANLIIDAVNSGKIAENSIANWEEIGKERGFKALKNLLNGIPTPKNQKFSTMIKEGGDYKTREEALNAFKAGKITAGEYGNLIKKLK